MARNWKWFVPVGCLGTIVLAAAAVVGFIFLIMGGIQSTDVFQNALAKARANAQLIVAIGEPMDPSFITTGTISTSGSSGEANLEAYLRGPDGGARLYIVADQVRGEWIYKHLTAELDDGQGTINLLIE